MNTKKKYLKILLLLALPIFISYSSELITQAHIFPIRDLPFFITSVVINFLIFLVIWAILNKAHISFLITFLFIFLLSCVSYFKYIARGIPLYLTDYTYFLKIFGVADSSNIAITPYIIFSFLFGIILFLIIKKVQLKVINLKTRLFTFLISSIVIIILYKFNFLLWESTLDPYEKNFILGFFNNVTTTYASDNFETNGDFDSSKYNFEHLDNYLAHVENNINKNKLYSKIKPNVIIILSESFWDITTLSNLSLSEEPITNFKRLKNESVTGILNPPTFGGGTADVEFEVQTGFINKFIKTTSTAFETYINKPTLSLSSIFKNHGYNTVGIHTYLKDFYNRNTVYPYLGYDKFIGIEDLKKPIYNGTYVSDTVITDLIIENLEESEEPIFIFAITMENHQPYTSKKYENTSIKVLNHDVPQELKESIEAYATGVHHADMEFNRLVEYLRNQQEPTTLLFFGDHQPTIGSDFGIYRYTKEITDTNKKTPQDFQKLLSTPFLIWSNYKTETGYVPSIGTNFIGNYLLNYLSLEKPLFYHFLDEAYENFHFAGRNELFIDSQNNLFESVPEQHEELISMYNLFQHDILLGEEYVKEKIEKIIYYMNPRK